jgi:uncharacterized membrane protein YgdD (TMEM256/DUF423 family)
MQFAIILGAFFAFLAIALGAFGAHGLKDKFKEQKYADNWETGCQYFMYNALGLVLVGILHNVLGVSGTLTAAVWCMVVGGLIFSGSLWILSLTGIKKLGAITPIGGILQLTAWICVMISAI